MADRRILDRLRERYAKLRKSEKLVADYLREHASERLDLSITELANRLDVSEATISRFTKALGYKGFSDMKLALASESGGAEPFANIPLTMLETDSLVDVSRKLYSALGSSIGETQKHLDYANIQAAVSHVLSARQVIFFGVGGAGAVCDEAAHLLLKAGVHTASYKDGYTQIISATTTSDSVTVVGISHTGTTATVADGLSLARERKAKTIAITNVPDSLVGQAAEILLLTRTNDAPQVPLYGDFLDGRISQLYIIYLIYLGVLFQSGGAAQACLAETAESLSTHYLRSRTSSDTP